MPGPGTCLYCLYVCRYLFLHVACCAVFFSWLSNYPSYLYLAVVWMSSVDTLCLVYTSPRRLPDLFAGPMMIRRSQIKISKAEQSKGYEFKSFAASCSSRLRSSAAAWRTASSSSLAGTSMMVSTQARAHAPLPALVPPSTCRFSPESFRASHRARVGCVSARSARRLA